MGQFNTGKSVVASDSTTEITIQDIAGSEFDIYVPYTAHIVAVMSLQSSVDAINEFGNFAININGVDSPEIKRKYSSTSDKASIGVCFRTSEKLVAGTYTVKGRFYCDNGNTLTVTNATLIAIVCVDDEGHTIPTGYSTVASDTTTATSFEDIDGLSETLTLENVWGIMGILTATTSVSVANKLADMAVNINGTDYETRRKQIGANNAGAASAIGCQCGQIGVNTVKGRHHTDGVTTLTTAPSILVSMGMEGGKDILIRGMPSTATGISTTATALEDMTGVESIVETKKTSNILAFMTLSSYTADNAKLGYFAISINGTDYEVITRYHGTTDRGSIMVVARTTTPLPAGTYSVKGRWYTESGTTLNGDDIHLTAFGAEMSKSPETYEATPKLYDIQLDYSQPPVMSGISPSSSPIGVTQPVVITGTDLTDVLTISWNGIPLDFTIDGSTQITITDVSVLPVGSYNFLYTDSETAYISDVALTITPQTFQATPSLFEIILDYSPSISVTNFSPTSGDVDSVVEVSMTGFELDTVTNVSLNGANLSFNSPDANTLNVTVENLTFLGTFPFYIESSLDNFYTDQQYTVFSAVYADPPTVNKRLRYGKFYSTLGLIKYPSK